MILGIALGFGAATSNSIAYLLSRSFLSKHNKGYFHLLAFSHTILGLISICLVPLFFTENMPKISEYATSLASAALLYFGAQASLFMTLRKTEPSRVAPLLGSKIIILALISIIFLDKHFVPAQWLAIFFSFSAAIILSGAGSRIPLSSFFFVMLTCLGYSLSDLNIANLIGNFEAAGFSLVRACMFSTVLCYIVCGFLSVIILILLPDKQISMFKDVLPFAVFWYAAMFFLFGCFGTIGIMYGNIIQSTRGIISVIIAAVISTIIGFQHLEKKVTKMVLLRRITAAILMTTAIALFYINRKPEEQNKSAAARAARLTSTPQICDK